MSILFNQPDSCHCCVTIDSCHCCVTICDTSECVGFNSTFQLGTCITNIVILTTTNTRDMKVQGTSAEGENWLCLSYNIHIHTCISFGKGQHSTYASSSPYISNCINYTSYRFDTVVMACCSFQICNRLEEVNIMYNHKSLGQYIVT